MSFKMWNEKRWSESKDLQETEQETSYKNYTTNAPYPAVQPKSNVP